MNAKDLHISLFILLNINFAVDGRCYSGTFKEYSRRSQTFLHCVNGKYQEYTCPEGWYWNHDKKICYYTPDSSDCKITSGNILDERDDNKLIQCVDIIPTNDEQVGCNLNSRNNCFQLSIISSQACVNGQYQSNPENCSSYFQCLKGKFVPKICTSGLEWNSTINRCEWPWNAQCKVTSECKFGEYRPNNNNASSFYKCEHGKFIEKYCPEGLKWSGDLKKCDWLKAVHIIFSNNNTSDNQTTTEANSSKEDNSSSEEDNISYETETETPESTTETDVCPPPTICKSGEYLPNKNNCSSFFYCMRGKPVEISCPNDFHWNKKENHCDWTEKARCKTGCSEEIFDDECENKTYLANLENCTSYFECEDGVKVAKICPSGYHWNDEYSICIFPHLANCDPNAVDPNTEPTETETTTEKDDNEDELPKDCKHAEYLPHARNCSLFYYCIHGNPVQISCPSELHWSKEERKCLWPEKAKCDPKYVNNTKKNCVDNEYMPVQGDCTSFYACEKGIKVRYQCPYTYWDNESKVCTRKRPASCSFKRNKK